MRRVAVAAALLLAGCVSAKLSFTCGPGRSCGAGGVCVDGSCAFAALDCTSGFRFDKSAGPRAGMCVSDSIDLGIDQGTSGPLDLAQSPPDLVGLDLTGCVPAQSEDCFNGKDDTCDGLVDCQDPQCMTSAECEPDESGFTLGAEVAFQASCPSGYSAGATDLSQGLNPTGGCTGCSCSPVMDCVTHITDVTSTCPGTAGGNSYVVRSTACSNNGSNGFNIVSGHVKTDALTAQPGCNPSGLPKATPIRWTSQVRFCATSQKGGGCGPGQVCVPKATKHCALMAGNVACAGAYTAEGQGSGQPWYTGIDDMRVCTNDKGSATSCTCGSPVGGGCGTSTVSAFHSDKNCMGSAYVMTPGMCYDLPTAAINSAQVALVGVTNPSCTPTYSQTGSATPTGPQTLCCLP